MDKEELTIIAEEIALSVIGRGLVQQGEGEFWLVNLGAVVALEANERGFENATEIAEEAVQIYRKRLSSNSQK